MFQGSGSQEGGVGGFFASDEFEFQVDSVSGKNNDGSDSDSSKLIGCNNQQVGVVLNLSVDSPLPLGLTLTKTPSFEDLIIQLSRKTNSLIDTNHQNQTTNYEKLKASNFCAHILKIGTWQRISIHEGHLVAKCYYAKQKLVWEVLEQGLKSKIEFQWSEISAIRATFGQNEPGILEIELNNPPLFFRETDPQPRKHTLWQPTSDFTGGQAPICRRHYLQFPEGTLEKHYEKLLQCDKRLFMLSQRSFPSQNSPYFSNFYGHQDFSFETNGCGPSYTPVLQFPHLSTPKPISVPSHQFHSSNPTIRSSICATSNLASPMSVMDFSPVDEYGSNHGNDGHIHTRKGEYVREAPTMGSNNLLTRGDGSGKPLSNNWVPHELAEYLQNDSQMVCSYEQMPLAKVNYLCSPLKAPEELSPIENTGIPRCTEQLNGNSGLLCPPSVSWLAADQLIDEDLPTNILHSLLFEDLQEETFACNELGNEANIWR